METSRTERAFLSLGSNVGDRSANLKLAIERLRDLGTIAALSSLYESEPVELAGQQPWFLNCVAALDTDLAPGDLLRSLLTLEREMGRVRWKEKGSRTIDIDIVLYGNCVIEEPGLKIPHPAMIRRRFVLEPLAEIAPGAFHPVLRKATRELLDELPPGQSVRRLPKSE